MPPQNNYNNPKGYALCIGINNFSIEKDLFHCLNDVDFWSNFLSSTCRYNIVRNLKENEATKKNVFMALWCLAAHSLPGDIVTIMFASHGTNASENLVTVADGKISESVFRLFLRAFKPGVRVVVLTDTCQSGTFVDYKPPRDISENSKNELINFFCTKLPHARNELTTLINTSKETPLAAYIAHFSSSSDDSNIQDGILVKCTKELRIWGLEWQMLEEYRSVMQEKFREKMYEPFTSVGNILKYAEKKHEIKELLISESKKEGHSILYSFLIITLLNYEKTILLVKKLRNINYEDLDENNENLYASTLDSIINNAKYNFKAIPVLSFHGKKSLAFQHQYSFAKNSPAFQREHQ